MKKVILYILTLSMLLGMFTFSQAPAVAQLSAPTTTQPTGYTTPINSLADFRAMASGGTYYLCTDIVMDAPYQFPPNVKINGNGHAILPPEGTNRQNPIQSSNLYHYTPGEVYSTFCFFYFPFTTNDKIVFENISFGTAQRPFCMNDDLNPTNGCGMALFPTSLHLRELVCTNVDFHVTITEPERGTSGNNAGFMSVGYNTITMTNCNIGVFIDANTTSQAGGFFAQTSTGTNTKLTMTNCTVLPGSHIRKRAQTAGFVAQLSGTGVFNGCVNYADLDQTGGEHAGGIIANFNENGVAVSFNRCINYGTIHGMYTVGGICGTLSGSTSYKSTETPMQISFTNCLNAGDVGPSPATTTTTTNGDGTTTTTTTYYGERIGGVLGRMEGKIKLTFNNCVNVGVIHGPEKETSEINGYFYDSVGQIMGGIHQVSQAKNVETGVYTPRPGDGVSHPYYSEASGRSDAGWTWHYIYDSLPVIFQNCYAYGNISLPAHAVELNTATGQDKVVTNEEPEIALGVGDIAHHGFAGTPVVVDAASLTSPKSNWQINQNNGINSHWYEPGIGTIGTVEYNADGLTRLNNWLSAQGIVGTYMLDASRTAKNEVTFPYLEGTPRINAYLCDAEHKNIRIVGVVNTIKYSKVGFNYSVRVNDAVEFVSTDHWTTVAYKDVGLKTAEQLSGEYLYEMTFTNVPTDKKVVINIVPKAVTTGGTEYIGQRYYLTFENGKFVKCQITNP